MSNARFVSMALACYVDREGRLPEKGIRQALAAIEMEPRHFRCPQVPDGAPDGGWQMLQASDEAWEDILSSLPATPVPVACRVPLAWCVAAQTVAGERKRVVVCIEDESPPRRLQGGEEEVQRRIGSGLFLWVYAIPERELRSKLCVVNRVLRAHGEPEILLTDGLSGGATQHEGPR